MEMNIHKLAAFIERVCHEGIAEEEVVLEWRLAGKPAKRQWITSTNGADSTEAVILAKAS